MGGGLAAAIKERYPDAYSSDMAYHWPVKIGVPNQEKLGDFSYAYTPIDGRWILNLYGQLCYGREKQHTNYLALRSALTKARAWYIDFKREDKFNIPNVLAFPYLMGCGLGGGNWDIVHSIIEDTFIHSSLEIWICEKP